MPSCGGPPTSLLRLCAHDGVVRGVLDSFVRRAWSDRLPLYQFSSKISGGGWIVGRSHREHQTAMVLIFFTSVLLWNLRRLPWILSSLVVDAIGDSRYAPYIVSNLASVILPPVCILIGGLWNTPPKITAPIHEKKVAT